MWIAWERDFKAEDFFFPDVIWTNLADTVVTSVLTNMGKKVGFCSKQLGTIREQHKQPFVALNQRLDPDLGPGEKSPLLDSLVYVIFLPALAQLVLCGEKSRSFSHFLLTRVGGGTLGA